MTAPRFGLTAGDPGPFPLPTEEPCCAPACWCSTQTSSPPDPCPEEWVIPGARPRQALVSPLLADLRAALDAVLAHGPLSGSRADTAALLELAERARAAALRELAEMDAVGGHLRPGVRSTTASWLRDEQRLSDGAARAAVGLATALRDDLPGVGKELGCGQITVEHAAAVVSGVRGLDREVVREAEDGLCALARLTDPPELRRRLRDKAAAIDDRIAAEAERRARERMGLRLSDVGAHTAVEGTLAGEDGARVQLAMALAVEAARQAGDTRCRAARQAEVLVRWAEDYLIREHGPGHSVADDAHTVRTHLHVLCRPEQLTGPGEPDDTAVTLGGLLADDLAGGPAAAPSIAGAAGPLSRGALRRLACDAVVDVVALTSPALQTCADDRAAPCRQLGDPLYVGRAARTVSGSQFRALVVRDRTCVVKGCRRPPAACAAHHVRHWADGGASDLDNLVHRQSPPTSRHSTLAWLSGGCRSGYAGRGRRPSQRRASAKHPCRASHPSEGCLASTSCKTRTDEDRRA
jgi:hypothetical protein